MAPIKNENILRQNDRGYKQKKALTKMQDDLIVAIETLNYSLFVDLGGTNTADLNFRK